MRSNCKNGIIKNFEPYFNYLATYDYIQKLKENFNKFIPLDTIDKVKKESRDESWIITFGYNDKAFTNKGGWYSTDPYPFLTSDGLSYIDMYNLNKDILKKDLNMNNFITPFNRNKDLTNRNNCFLLDKNKVIYRENYPIVDDYKHVYIIHIPA